MSFFLVFLAIALVGAVLWTGLGRRPGAVGEAGAGRAADRPLPVLLDGGLPQPPANLPPVLLPSHATPEDVDRVRFSVGLRGYRMDQVDQVLDDLRNQLAAREAEIEELRSRRPAEQDSA
ncbi:DivIVA domain-containing protein [Pseudarthrobacter sp. NPDC092439]|uniref:DivIVA domain-containing protein n=1 Tax=unclassified Pseudarthrobacter TaxID=2647000 RepID=UPI0038162EF5